MQHSMKMLAALGVVALALTGCAAGGGDAPADGEPIVIGTSLPMTGPLASFGPILEAGYQAAVDDVNAAGGIEIDGTAHQVELKVAATPTPSPSRRAPSCCRTVPSDCSGR